MREYKFRGKSVDNEEWMKGSLVIYESKYYILLDITEHIKRQDFEVFMIEVIPNTVGQYTGLQDKNGKEIYEGDILKIPEWLMEDIQENCLCIYNQENNVNSIIGFGLYIRDGYTKRFQILLQSDEWDEFEVIGNTTDNPELLKEE